MSRQPSLRGLPVATILGLAALVIVAPARAEALRYNVEAFPLRGIDDDRSADTYGFGNGPDGKPLLSFEPAQDGLLPSLDGSTSSRIVVGELVINTPEPGSSITSSGKFALGVSIPELGKWTTHGPSDPMGFTQEHSGVTTQGLITGRLASDGSTHLTLTSDPFQVGYLGPIVTAGRHVYTFPIDTGRVAFIPLDIKLAPGETTARVPVELQILPVPEPTALVPLAALGIWLIRRRRKSA